MGLAGDRMSEGQDLSMQGNAVDGVSAGPIFFVTNNRMSNLLHMHPDLMLAARIKVDLQ